MTYAALMHDDPSNGKLAELEARLIAASKTGRIKWTRSTRYSPSSPETDRLLYTGATGCVEVSGEGILIRDDAGALVRAYRPPTNDLLNAAQKAANKETSETIDALLKDLERM